MLSIERNSVKFTLDKIRVKIQSESRVIGHSIRYFAIRSDVFLFVCLFFERERERETPTPIREF